MNRHAPLPALEKAKTPRVTKITSRIALTIVLLTPFLLALVPWQQTVHGLGRATAFNPVYRTQFLVSPIEARVKKWHVVEGQRVKQGDRVAELIDNDPMLETRLEQELQALMDRRTAAVSRVEQIDLSLRNLEDSFKIQKQQQRVMVEMEQQQLLRSGQEKLDADAALIAAVQHEDRMKELIQKGGVAQREVETAVRDTKQMKARLESASLAIEVRKKALQNATDFVERIEKDSVTAVSRETASKESAKAEVAAADAAISQMNVRIARQRAQFIDSPCDGIVYRLLANAEMGGMLVRPGERLAMIVPDIKAGLPTTDANGKAAPGIVAELFIDGNDLPLVRLGDRVRLQFEGWPAVQFAAMPEAAAGTFGGRVLLIDPAAHERGNFRIVIEPDLEEQKDPAKRWPNEDYLRQGVQLQGWILLDAAENRVTLGWELWRRLNGFPVTRSVTK